MDEKQRADFADGHDAAVALLHPDGKPMRRHIVAVEDCVEAYLLALRTEGIEGETYHVAMNDPFDYREAATYAAEKLGIEVIELVDPVGQDFCVDVTKARYQLGYQPQYEVRALIDQAVAFRRSGKSRRPRSGAKG
jgi:nucleoside-diphosphate-sugar epimerase